MDDARPVVADLIDRLGSRMRLVQDQAGLAMLTHGALDRKTTQLIAVAVASVTNCHRCCERHVAVASRAGNSRQELLEAIWVALEVKAGGTFPHGPAPSRDGPGLRLVQ